MPDTDWMWVYENPKDAAAEIDRLRKVEAAAALCLHEMKHTVAPRDSFTDAVDAMDAALDPH